MPIAGAIIGVGGSLISGAMGSSASKKAAKAQSEAAHEAAQVQRDAITQSRIDSYPWALSGATAMYKYMDELGIPRPQTPILPDLTQGPFGVGGTAQTAQQPAQPVQQTNALQSILGNRFGPMSSQAGIPDFSPVQPAAQPAQNALAPSPYKSPSEIPMTADKGFQETPGYQFQVEEGEKGVLNNLAALGMKNSGAALKALTRFRTGLANQEYGNYLNRLAGVAGMGQSQTQSNNNMLMTGASNVGNALQNAGEARASGYVGSANAWQNAIGSGVKSINNALGQMSYGMGTNYFPPVPV